MPHRTLFITGTDTGVGKTIAAAALLGCLRRRGRRAAPMKPVQTGWPASDDLAFVLAAADWQPEAAEQRLMRPYQFKLAASPHLAAQREDSRVSVDYLQHALADLQRRYELVVVEGAGGVLTPLDEKLTMLDLMRAMGLPALVIARSGLGTINHTLLTLREIERAGLAAAAVLMVEERAGVWDEIAENNRLTLAARGRAPAVLRFPRLPDVTPAGLRESFQSLENIFRKVPMIGNLFEATHNIQHPTFNIQS
jgi:dethiobiotin synthetase